MPELWCPACDTSVDRFLPGPGGHRPRARCPDCDALERHRFLAILLREDPSLRSPATRVLDIAPQPSVRRLLQTGRRSGHYVGLDVTPALHPGVVGSITALPIADRSIDLAVCFHVLEHVADDQAAMRELARVLTPGGVMYLQVPRRRGRPTEEDPEAPPDERIARFGQADHVRYYGDDFELRLRSAGLSVSVIWPQLVMDPHSIDRLGLLPDEWIWICRPMSVTLEPSAEVARRLDQVTTQHEALRNHPAVKALVWTRRSVRRLRRAR